MASFFSDHKNHPANVICELCRLFYDNNWVTGTGGGISIRDVDGENPDIVYIAPSGIQKERLHPKEMFVAELPDKILRSPNEDNEKEPLSLDLAANFKYKPLACTPLFLSIYNLRDAGACIHTHSQNAVLATMIWEDKLVFEMNNQEQIKALPKLEMNVATGKIEKVGSLHNHETMVIPIVDNTPLEEDLTETLEATLKKYPGATAVLVRRHGIHVWGENIWKAKIYNEAIDYLLELAIKMHQNGIPLIKD
ncbi:Methylthioribulose-1-phosphate dehydratase [Metschnikowia bicuspidata var. bicuspidata NRRL YB-4993]|uniref:Methylthioribulose-1-phosphate dehydratase n=1 Tax=Metschnikowia bicuspidata var. bicuspidata NRRL YB-4993 TaxID=869754 RepID=A0A1A0H8C8_9ASCO|nr:Methylthioribulose-1-phosphate dehydratase [Metschnikowia bicuspidata var. bicuspidata NRRL YB-4993]OBA20235.1 Methylthioribulose-1-phosphate dehydratase [Metschnikowia bicuspidata var. bicuspidata NRRL YB-4993]